MWDLLFVNANLACMTEGGAPYGAVQNGALAVAGEEITFIGGRDELPAPAEDLATEVVDAEGRWITPGLIDCHTHLVYAGSRAGEFERRLGGASYEEIAREGGGIVSTVRATRDADRDRLFEESAVRFCSLLREGVTTIEIKSGYGLDLETELEQLRIARRLASIAGRVVTTYLGAHALPPEFAGRSEDYISLVCDEVLPAVAAEGLADAVDAYCERIAFTPEQTQRVFEAARTHGLPVKLHADQLSDTGGAELAARYGALSADHLEYTSEDGVRALAASGTVAVLLPGAFYVLRETRLPPIAALREHGVPIAVATDCNPGSSPVESLLLMVSMACTLFGLTPEEALAGVTRNAAAALGLGEAIGTLATGKRADLVLWDITEPAELAYRVGAQPFKEVVIAGRQRTPR